MKIFLLHILTIILFCFQPVYSQFSIDENIGVNLSINYSIGTHFQRFGLAANFYVFYKYFQFSNRIDYHYNHKNLGAPLQGHELQINNAILIAYGQDDSIFYPQKDCQFFIQQFNYLQNFTGKKYSIAYSYNFYFDQIESSQPSGTIYLQFKRLEILSENDLFGKPSVDKFRTGSFKIAYNFPQFTLAINSLTWTGNPRGTPRSNNSEYKGRWGYKDLSEAKYGKYSHGIVALSVEKVCFSFLSQNIFTFSNNSMQIGIDSEYIRHFMQNILIHDFYFVPKKWNKARNPHYPMLMDNGEPYLFKNGQKVKKMKLYFNFGSNTSVSY